MPLIKPFRALRYNPNIIKDFWKVVCPPYDVIEKKDRNHFKHLSPYNFCNILIIDSQNTYADLAKRFQEWISKGVLIQEQEPALYLYEQCYRFGNKLYYRVGFLGLLRIDRRERVLPHERTFLLHRKDRLAILKHFKANLSPIFVVTQKNLNTLNYCYNLYKKKSPIIDFFDKQNIRNRIWLIRNRTLWKKIEYEISRDKLFIADGHHRFEVAYKYYQMMKGKIKDANYILAYFTHPQDLMILPTHRILEMKLEPEYLRVKLAEYFNILPVNKKEIINTFNNLNGNDELRWGLLYDSKFFILDLKNNEILSKILSSKDNNLFKELNVVILHRIINKIIPNARLSYTHSLEEAFKIGKRKIVFLLKNVSIDTVFKFAKKGLRLPQKTTYFYPKLLSGILVRRLEDANF